MNNINMSINQIKKEHAKKDIINIAKTFLYFESMTHKKLQKLCYYAQAWYFTHNDEALVMSQFSAWVHGAVSTELYVFYKKYNGRMIPKEKEMPEVIKEDKVLTEFLLYIFKTYGVFSGKELEALNQSEKPWKEARGNLFAWQRCDKSISLKTMKNYYSKILKN